MSPRRPEDDRAARPRPGGLPAAFGPYRVEGELARGGMGVVLRVRHEGTGQAYALKTLLGAASAQHAAALRLRLAREAEALARVDEHPHIVRVHAADLAHDPPYLVETLLPGGSLAARLVRDGPLPPAEAAALVARLARAVHHAHGRGVLHRDLKPENVLFDEQGAPRVVDLGLAGVADGAAERLTRTGELLGTPAYMAPEQARGGPVDARTDVHGLGGLLFASLTGRPPHAGATPFAVLEAVLRQRPPAPGALRPGVPAALDAVAARALAPDPGERFPTAAALADALEVAVAPGERAAAPRAAAALALAGLVVIGGVVVVVAGAAPPGRSGDAPARPSTSTPTPTPPPPPATATAAGPPAAAPPAERPPAGPVLLARACPRLEAAGGATAAAPLAALRAALVAGEALRPATPAELEALDAGLGAARARQGDREAALAAAREGLVPGGFGPALTEALEALARARPEARERLVVAAAPAAPGTPVARRLAEELARRAADVGAPGVEDLLRGDELAVRQATALLPALRALRLADVGAPVYAADRPGGFLYDLAARVASRSLSGLDERPARARRHELLAPLAALFPEDPALTYAALASAPATPSAALGERAAAALERLAGLADDDGRRGALHKALLNTARDHLAATDAPRLLEVLRREATRPYAGAPAHLRLFELLAATALGAAAPARDALGQEARAALARAATAGGEWLTSRSSDRREYQQALCPSWFDALAPGARPPLPLPARAFFGASPGTYVLFGRTADAARAAPEGLGLVWVAAQGAFVGRADVPPEALRAAPAAAPGAPAPGGDGLVDRDRAEAFARWFGARLPTPAEWAAAAPQCGGGPAPWCADGPAPPAPAPARGVHLALDPER